MTAIVNSLKKTTGDAVVYGFGNIAVKIVGFILLPLYTNPEYFSVNDFGVIAILDITGMVLLAFMASGLTQSLMRWYWDKDHSGNQKGIFFMSLTTQSVISILFCLLLFPFSRQLSTVIFSTAEWNNTIKLLILSSALQAINNIIIALMRLQSKSVLYSVTNIAKLLIVLSLTIYLIVFRNMGIKGIYLAQVTGNFLFIAAVSVYTLKNCRIYYNRSIFFSMSRYGYPILLANIAATTLTVIDRYSLNSLTLLKYVAIYALAYKISSVLRLVIVDSVKMAVMPAALKKMNYPGNKRFYSKTLLYSSYVLTFGMIGLSLFSYEIIKLITGSKEYWSSFYIVPLLSLSVFFTNMREMSSWGLIIAKKTRIIGMDAVVAALINILLNILLIPLWDITGAAVATIYTQFSYWLLNYYFSQKEYHVPYEIRKLAILFVLGGALSFSGLLMTGMDLIPRLLLKTACLTGFPFLLYLFNFYEPVELQSIKGFITKWSNLKKFRENLSSLKELTNNS